MKYTYQEASQCWSRHHYRANGKHTSPKPIAPYSDEYKKAKELISFYGWKGSVKFIELLRENNKLRKILKFEILEDLNTQSWDEILDYLKRLKHCRY